ncbi:hypothetical protein EC179100_5516 [Escherichia coli 179100]|nr:hypothetical protein EC179100_5516 [Escherichia coli 179100]KDT07011.1 hypothetical protein AB54_5096 [Escherichia coli 2-011-08_S1_C3]
MRKAVVTLSGIDRKYYEFCVLNELKGAVRVSASDIRR